MLAFALTSRELRLGSVCFDLTQAQALPPLSAITDGDDHRPVEVEWPAAEEWLSAVRESPAVAFPEGEARPFRLSETWLYLERFWSEEAMVARHLARRAKLASPPTLTPAIPAGVGPAPDAGQSAAVAAAVRNWTTVITGGPGTGKTTTVGSLLTQLNDPERTLLVALAAPTGKAAARLEASVAEHGVGDLNLQISGGTLHGLLGVVPGRSSRDFHRGNPLPQDLIIVDETSMVSLSMMSWLLDAVSDTTRLILVGDPHQLESVEAGSVLADIASGVLGDRGPAVAELTHNWRSQANITALAEAIRTGRAEDAVDLATGDQDCTLESFDGTQPLADFASMVASVVEQAEQVQQAAQQGDGSGALRLLERHRLLCAHREGPFGLSRWAGAVRSLLGTELSGFAGDRRSYPGQPLLITRNSHLANNGDTAVVVRRGDDLVAWVDRPDGPLGVDPSVLDHTSELFAMTIHKSQGSQFDEVSVVLPPIGSPLLTRELLYTAITRAKRRVRIIGSPEALISAVRTPTRRVSGLGRAAGA
ncbi:MAG: exodeoxyribonuclease V subunit alpha [Arachnia sp.]